MAVVVVVVVVVVVDDNDDDDDDDTGKAPCEMCHCGGCVLATCGGVLAPPSSVGVALPVIASISPDADRALDEGMNQRHDDVTGSTSAIFPLWATGVNKLFFRCYIMCEVCYIISHFTSAIFPLWATGVNKLFFKCCIMCEVSYIFSKYAAHAACSAPDRESALDEVG